MMENTKKGWVYAATNDFMPDVIKIGFTKDLEQRIKSLSNNTNIPEKFEYVHTRLFEDCEKAEKIVHKILEQYRVPSGKEFFKIDNFTATQVIERVFLEEKLEKHDQILARLEKKLDEQANKIEYLEKQIESLEQESEGLGEQIQNLEETEKEFRAIGAIQDSKYNFLFRKYILDNLKESIVLENEIEFLFSEIERTLAEFRICKRAVKRGANLLDLIYSLKRQLSILKNHSESTIKKVEKFLEKNPTPNLLEKLENLKTNVLEIDNNLSLESDETISLFPQNP